MDSISDYKLLKKKLLNELSAPVSRIIELAEGFGGQSRYAASILFSIYEPEKYKMSSCDFSSLDCIYIDDVIRIFEIAVRTRVFIFDAIDDGEQRLINLLKRYELN